MIDPDRLPNHIGIIMDGNGRWARQRRLARSAGHREGLNAAKEIVRAASDIGIRYLTLYTFSTENWRRTEEEVSFLMKLIETHLKNEYEFYRSNHIRVVHSGDIARLPGPIQREIGSVMRDIEHFTGLTVNLAINYGGRDEIVRAVNRWRSSTEGERDLAFDESTIKSFLDCPEMPDADLIIRTGGEQRLSNFLLWESAYAEYHFSKKYWPDFRTADLVSAIEDFQHRTRKFGGMDPGPENTAHQPAGGVL